MNFLVKTIQECLFYGNYEVCISCSLFKLNRYGETYRDFYKYVNDFKKWINKIPKKSYVRMYVDESVLNDENFIKLFNKRYENLEIVLFEFEEFRITKKDQNNPSFEGVDIIEGTHDGTFGTIVRFLPLYNLPKLPSNVKYIWISDIDLPYNIFSYDNILDLKKYKADISFFSSACNNREWFPPEVKYPIGAGKIIVSRNVKFDIEDFYNFLNDVVKGKYESVKNKIMESRRKVNYHFAPAKYFTYGFDELFVNTYLYHTITEYKYLVYYEISLDNYKYIKEFPNYQEYSRLKESMWRNPDLNTYKNKLKLKYYNDKYYSIIKEVKVNDERLKLCRKEYTKYSNKIVKNPNTNWGLTTLIIKE